MADYLKALSAGVTASQQAAKNFLSIRSVIEDASKQLTKGTRRRISLMTRAATRAVPSPPSPVPTLGLTIGPLMGLAQRRGGVELVEYTALTLVIEGMADGSVDLCEWITHQDGFPVRLKFSGKEVSCHDKRSLEVGLESVLSDSRNGSQIALLLSKADIDLPGPMGLSQPNVGPDDELI